MTSALHGDLTSAVLADVAALQPWFTPPQDKQVETQAVACALAAACYAPPSYTREDGRDGQPLWWPFRTGYTPRGDRYGEMLAAAGFLLAAYRENPGGAPAADPLNGVATIRRRLTGPAPGRSRPQHPGIRRRLIGQGERAFAAQPESTDQLIAVPLGRSPVLNTRVEARNWLTVGQYDRQLQLCAPLVINHGESCRMRDARHHRKEHTTEHNT